MAVYLIHFDEPFKHAKHYIGFSENEQTLPARLEHHRKGTGANLLRVLKDHGIGWTHVRTWADGDRNFERKLKSHSGTRYCPTCRGDAALKSKAA